MPRQKKDGKFVNFYMDSELLQRLESFCDKTGLTKTAALERAISYWLDYEEYDNSRFVDVRANTNKSKR